MKILYINALYSPFIEGGAEISLKLIVEGMKSLGHEVCVLSMMPDQGMKTDLVDGIKVYRAGLSNQYWPFSKRKHNKLNRLAWHYRDRSNPAMAKVISEILAKERPDIVSCHNIVGWSAAVWEPIFKANIPIVQVLHDLYLLCANSNMFKDGHACESQCYSCKLLRSNHPEKSKQVSAVVGISNSILQRFIGFGYFQNATKHVIYNTRSIPAPQKLPLREKEQRMKYGYIGTLSRVKGLDWLIEQFKKLNFNSTLKIAGKGDQAYEAHLREIAKDASIEFVGYVNSTEFVAEIDVLIVPSLWEEPLGMVAIESLANHVPVIANKRGGLQETVKDGVNGLYCYDDRPDSLSEAMTDLFEHPAKYNQYSSSARESVASILDADRLISEYELVLKETLERSNKSVVK